MQVVKVGLTSLDPQLSLMWLVLSIDCLQKCDTGAALLSTCWRRYKPPSPFITLLNFMVFTILSTPCYLFKDLGFLMSLSVMFHSLLPCGCVCGDLRAWICESVTPWCQLKSSSTSSRPPANFHTYLSCWTFEPIFGNEDLWIRGTWEWSWNHLPLSSRPPASPHHCLLECPNAFATFLQGASVNLW